MDKRDGEHHCVHVLTFWSVTGALGAVVLLQFGALIHDARGDGDVHNRLEHLEGEDHPVDAAAHTAELLQIGRLEIVVGHNVDAIAALVLTGKKEIVARAATERRILAAIANIPRGP